MTQHKTRKVESEVAIVMATELRGSSRGTAVFSDLIRSVTTIYLGSTSRSFRLVSVLLCEEVELIRLKLLHCLKLASSNFSMFSRQERL